MIAESLLDREAIAGAWGRYGVARLRVFGSALVSSVALFDDGGVVSGDDDWVGKRPAGTFPAGRWSSW